jgi:coatomer subunit beta'
VICILDEGLIKQWNWEDSWTLKQTFEGHINYVMQVALNPHDSQIFASASLDGTIKVWHLDSSQADLTLEGHAKGVNCVSFYADGNQPYLLSGGDDGLVKIWDYQVRWRLLLAI